MHGHPERDRLDLEHTQLPVGAEVGLRQHDHGLGAALPRHRDVALEPAEVEVLVERHDEEDRVHVRRQHLLLGGVERDLARELRAAGEDLLDRRRALVRPRSGRDPVADGGQIAGTVRLVREPARELGPQLAELRQQDIGAAMLCGDAGRQQAGRAMRFELCRVAVSPAEVLQCVQARLLERRVSGRARRSSACAAQGAAGCGADCLEPRSSEGEGGKLGHLGHLSHLLQSSGRLEVCLRLVTKSNPHLGVFGQTH